MTQRKTPEDPRQTKGDRASEDEMEHEPAGLSERLDEEPRGNVRHDHHRNDPAKDETEHARENDVGIARDVEEIEIAVNEPLRAHDPETERRQAQHDRVMHRDAEADRDDVKQDRAHARRDVKVRERDDDDDSAEDRVEHAIEAELFRGDGKLAVDWQDEERV